MVVGLEVAVAVEIFRALCTRFPWGLGVQYLSVPNP